MRRSQLEKLFAERDGDSLRTVCGSDFREYRRHVFVDAVLADPELFCYVAVGEASHHRLQNFGLKNWASIMFRCCRTIRVSRQSPRGRVQIAEWIVQGMFAPDATTLSGAIGVF